MAKIWFSYRHAHHLYTLMWLCISSFSVAPVCLSTANAQPRIQRSTSQASVEELVDAAIQRQRRSRPSLQGLRESSRWRALLPTLRLGGTFGENYDQSASFYGDQSRQNLSNDNRYNVNLSLSFDLRPLLYSADELAIERERRARVHADAILAERVIDTYTQLYIAVCRRPAASQHHVKQLEAKLAFFTGRAISRIIVCDERREEK